jgi:hypothetical protein
MLLRNIDANALFLHDRISETTNSDSWIRALYRGPGYRSSFAAEVECGDPCLLTDSLWDRGVYGLPTPVEDRQAAVYCLSVTVVLSCLGHMSRCSGPPIAGLN